MKNFNSNYKNYLSRSITSNKEKNTNKNSPNNVNGKIRKKFMTNVYQTINIQAVGV